MGIYTPPGITVVETTTPGSTPTTVTGTNVCVVGPTAGFQVLTTQITFDNNTNAVTFTAPSGGTIVPISGSQVFVSAVDAINPAKGALSASPGGVGYLEGTIVNGNPSPSNSDFTCSLNGDSTQVTISPTADPGGNPFHPETGGNISHYGATINFVYQFLPADNAYFQAVTYTNPSAVGSVYGSAWDTTQSQIGNPVSFAANLAFQNGAQFVTVQPLFKLSTPGDNSSQRLAPSGSDVASAQNWIDTFYALRVVPVDVVVPVIGQSFTNVNDSVQLAVYEALLDHEYYMQSGGSYIEGFFGDDSSLSPSVGQPSTLRSNAATLAQWRGGVLAQANTYVSPSSYYIPIPRDGTLLKVGGQYAAASMAGMFAGAPVSTPLTRKRLSGIVQVGELRTRQDKDADAQAGLSVLENIGSNSVQIRHALTLDTRDSAHRELSVVHAKFALIETLVAGFDDIFPIVSVTPTAVIESTAITILENLITQGIIAGYDGVTASLTSSDPTVGLLSFSFLPLFPLNYLQITFAVNLSSGTISVQTTG